MKRGITDDEWMSAGQGVWVIKDPTASSYARVSASTRPGSCSQHHRSLIRRRLSGDPSLGFTDPQVATVDDTKSDGLVTHIPDRERQALVVRTPETSWLLKLVADADGRVVVGAVAVGTRRSRKPSSARYSSSTADSAAEAANDRLGA